MIDEASATEIRARLTELRRSITSQRSPELLAEVIELEKRLLAQKQAALSKKSLALKDVERRARTQRLIKLGGLVEKAGLDNLDPAALLGGLLELAGIAGREPQRLAGWKATGGTALLNKPADERRPLIVTFPSPAPTEVRKGLRALKLRWSDVRQEWDGYADPSAVVALVAPVGGVVTEVAPPPPPSLSPAAAPPEAGNEEKL